jgi:hypothetical protein
MPYTTKCPECGKVIAHDGCDRFLVCECGWEEEDDYEESVANLCEDVGLDFESLKREFRGDLETIESLCHAISKDD